MRHWFPVWLVATRFDKTSCHALRGACELFRTPQVKILAAIVTTTVRDLLSRCLDHLLTSETTS